MKFNLKIFLNVTFLRLVTLHFPLVLFWVK